MVDQVETYEPPPGESQEYIQQMVDKAEQAQNPQTSQVDFSQEGQQQQRPEWLPEKFKSPEDLVESYRQLESRLGRQGQQQTGETELQPSSENVDQSYQEAEEVVENAGLDFQMLANEYAQNGELSDDSYNALSEAGIPQQMVDQFIEGQEAKTQLIQQNAFNIVGGEQRYKSMIEWAKGNLSKGEIEAFNQDIGQQDLERTQFAIKGLFTRYAMANGVQPNLVKGTGQARPGGFQSVAQLKEAMKDSRYKNDPAYRNEVMQKLSVSNIM